MNTRERYLALMTFEEVDRTLLWEFGYWAGTIRRWYREGLPKVKGIPEELGDGVGVSGESVGVRLGRYPADDVHDFFQTDPYLARMLLNIGAYPPFEVAAGMDIVEVREAFPKLGILGGIDKRALAKGKEAIDEELEKKVPFMLKSDGYIPTIDHLVSPDISFDDFKYYREKLREIVEKFAR